MATNSAVSPQSTSAGVVLLTAAFVAAVFAFAWIGYIDSDDEVYASAAMSWLNGPHVGQNHFAVRHPVVLSVAASFALFGVSVKSLALVSTLYATATLVLVLVALRRMFDGRAACLGVALLASLPIFATSATVTFCDTPEMFLVASSFALFVLATRSGNPVRWLIAAGVVAGLAYLSRATTVGLLASYGVLFLLGQGPRRAHYWWMAAGFLFVVGAEAAIMWAATGDPIYRLTLAWKNVAQVSLDDAGNTRVHPAIDPFLILLVNHEFAVFYYFAIPAAIWTVFRRPADRAGTPLLRWLVLGGVVWGITITLAVGKFGHPRYFLVTSICFVFPLVVWLREVVAPRKRLMWVSLLILFGGNLAAIYVDNKNPLSGEHMLRDYVASSDETVYTDPYTVARATFLLREHGLLGRVKEGAPPPGGLYFYNPGRLGRNFVGKQIDHEAHKPKPQWKMVLRRQPDRKWSGIVLEKLGLARFVPEGLYRRLDCPWAPVEVYRAPG